LDVRLVLAEVRGEDAGHAEVLHRLVYPGRLGGAEGGQVIL
jgi:hypothetical protein